MSSMFHPYRVHTVHSVKKRTMNFNTRIVMSHLVNQLISTHSADYPHHLHLKLWNALKISGMQTSAQQHGDYKNLTE